MAQQNVVINIQGDSGGLQRAATSGAAALASLNKATLKIAQSNTVLDSSVGRMRDSHGRFVGVVQQARAAAAQLTAEKQRMIQINELLEKSLTQEEMAILRSTGALQSMRGATGSADFALLSLTQGIQDAGNFGMGMAQGIRAVNNNLQAFITALVHSSQMSGGFINSISAMGKAMMGPAGLLFAFSAVSASIEFFSNRSQRATKEANDLAKSIKDVASSIFKEVGGAEGIMATPEQIRSILSDITRSIEGYEKAIGVIRNLNRTISGEELQAIQFQENRLELLEMEKEVLDEMLARYTLQEKLLAAMAGLKTVQDLNAQYDNFLATLKAINPALSITVAEFAKLSASGGLGAFLADARWDEARRQFEITQFRAERLSEAMIRLRDSFKKIDPDVGASTIGAGMEEIERRMNQSPFIRKLLGEEPMIAPDRLRQLGDATVTETQRTAEAMRTIDMTFAQTVTGLFNNNADHIVRFGSLIQQSLGGAGTSFMQLAKMGEEANMRLFRAGQAFGVAEAVVNTAVGITRAFRDLPFWLAIPAAASIAASGVAQIAAIKSASAGGSAPRSGASAINLSAPGPGTGTPSFGFSLGNASSFPSLSAGAVQSQAIRVTGTLTGEGRDLVAVVSSEVQAQSNLGIRNTLLTR